MMPELQQEMFTRQRKYLFFLLSFFVLGWGFTPYKAIFLGLLLGTAVSFYNLWMTHRKTNKLAEAVANGEKAYSLGYISRMAAAGLSVFIAMEFSETFHLISVVIGLMTSYMVIMIDFFIQHILKLLEER